MKNADIPDLCSEIVKYDGKREENAKTRRGADKYSLCSLSVFIENIAEISAQKFVCISHGDLFFHNVRPFRERSLSGYMCL